MPTLGDRTKEELKLNLDFADLSDDNVVRENDKLEQNAIKPVSGVEIDYIHANADCASIMGERSRKETSRRL